MASLAFASPKFTTLSIMVRSSCSNTPSSWLTFRMVRSSASVISGALSLESQPKILANVPVTTFKTATTGVKIQLKNAMRLTTINATFSAFCAAMVFGVISPKIKMMMVITAVATPAPLPASPLKIWIANAVVSADAPLFTRLLPTKIELKSLLGLSSSF